jgi:hypothetical protein
MLSPKAYFEDLIASQLQQFVHTIDKTQLSVGFLVVFVSLYICLNSYVVCL